MPHNARRAITAVADRARRAVSSNSREPHPSALGRARRLLGRARRRIGNAGRLPAEAPATPGVVEHFSRKFVRGWVSVPAAQEPVRVELFVNNLRVASTYATPVPAPAPPSGRPSAADQPTLAPTDQLPGPAKDLRNSRDEIRNFAFPVRGLWRYCAPKTRMTVRVDGWRLPIAGHGMYLNPISRGGRKSVAELRTLLDNGFVLSQKGDVQLSKQRDVEWQRVVLALYQKVRAILAEHHGYDAVLIYGTLLGAVRENGYIGHDVDFDAAYLSSLHDPDEVINEFERVALTLIKAGLEVDAKVTALHIYDPAEPGTRIDLFHLYCDVDGNVRFPFGYAGTSTLTEHDWAGTQEIDFAGGRVAVPVGAEKVVEHLYGSDWREPKPGFNWDKDRTTRAAEAGLTQERRTELYWANFYARTEYSTGSTFSEFVSNFEGAPTRIIDIGCGEGRDSCAFGSKGKRVLGLDQSQVGIEQATKHAANLGVADLVTFDICDVTDGERLRDVLTTFVGESQEPVVYYLRFFLHAISEAAQETVLRAIDASAREGDYFAAEFRTDKDEKNTKVHQKHYRRFQNAETFRDSLVQQHQFEVRHEEEGTGLSPYKEEDPVLYRVIAVRRGTPDGAHR